MKKTVWVQNQSYGTQRLVSVCFPSGPIRGWCRPLCIFFSTFTIVMLLLLMSVDLKRRQYLDYVIWDFEGSLQYSPDLVDTIRKDYIRPPNNLTVSDVSFAPSRQLLKIFKNQRNGVAIECGADSHLSDADWLVRNLDWRNLKVQPNPIEIELLRAGSHGAFTSHSCVSLDIAASHALMQTGTNFPNGTLMAVPCFPLFSLMRAFNATTTDLLIMNDVRLPLKILETLPIHDLVNIKTISFVTPGKKNKPDSVRFDDVCCSDETRELMKRWGYTTTSICPSRNTVCYFSCSKRFCPFIFS